jgi:hypothetical protein
VPTFSQDPYANVESFGTPALRSVLGIRLPTQTVAPVPAPPATAILPTTVPRPIVRIPYAPTNGNPLTIRPALPAAPTTSTGMGYDAGGQYVPSPGPAGIPGSISVPQSFGDAGGAPLGYTISGSADTSWLLWVGLAVVAILVLRR